MKTTKSKTAGRPKKSVDAVKTVGKKKVTARKNVTVKRKVTPQKAEPGEEEIRQKAYEIYNQRIVRGEGGSETDDWKRAIEILTDH